MAGFERYAVDRRVIMAVVAVACASGAATLIHRWLGEQKRQLAQERSRIAAAIHPPVEVVVAARDLAEGAPLEAADIQVVAVPENFLQPYAARSPSEVLGRVTAAPMATDEQILTNKLRRPDEAPAGSTLAALTPKGKRAVTISVDTLTGVGGFVRPGDAVDLVWTLTLPAQQGGGQTVTMTLFQDVPVLAVGRELKGRAARAPEPPSADYTVTLALTPTDTALLLFARDQGRVQLSLRSPSERGAQPVPPANINTLLEAQLGAPATAQAPPPPPPQKTAEIYKGLQREVVVLPQPDELAAPAR